MNREQRKVLQRKQLLQLKPDLDKLETRRLMSLGGVKARLDHEAVVRATTAIDGQLSEQNWGAFALSLAEHPVAASDIRLGALSTALRRHEGYAGRHGWEAALVSELTAHPRYAATHHLMAALNAPEAPSARPPGRKDTTATASAPPTIATKTLSAARNGAAVTPELAALQRLEQTLEKAAAALPRPPVVALPTPTAPITPTPPSVVVNDPLSVAVGGALDVTLPNLGFGTSGLTFTITPQPLPTNVTFNRQTGELIFTPAPGQQGSYDFSVTISNGSQNGLITVPVTVTAPALSSTELSGQVVDENGDPLPDMPVTIAGISTVTDSSGDFTLTGVPANPGPISAGGSVGSEQGRLDLTAPVAQLLGHGLYADTDNVIRSPLILPAINWSTAATFSQAPSASSVSITTPAMPGFSIQMPASATASSLTTGTVQVAQLPAALSAQHMAPGMTSGLLLLDIAGYSLTSSVQLTLPNLQGFQPGAVVYLTMFNPVTGGHDVVGQLVVSDDGETMTSTGPINLSTNANSATAGASPDLVVADDSSPYTGITACLGEEMTPPSGTPNSMCDGCQADAYETSSTPNTNPPPASGPELRAMVGSTSTTSASPSGVMDSDAGLVTGEYFLNNQLMTYQAQGQTLGINLQYSSAQADPTPVVQYEFTTPIDGDSSSISSITAQVSLGGVETDPVTYNTVDDPLADGETYNIPVQVDATELPTGVYTYTMTVTENFGIEDITSVTFVAQGSVNVVNESSDPLGAGWSVGGLQKLSQLATNGPVLITAGQQGTEAFQPAYADGQTYVQDLAISTNASSSQVLANDGTGYFTGPTVPAGDTVVGSASGIFTSSGEQDLAVVTSSTLQIEINNGSGGFTAGDGYAIPSGYEARGVVAGNFYGHDETDIAVLLTQTTGDRYYAIAVYVGAGDGTFSSPVVSAFSADGGEGGSDETQADSIVAGDFTGGSETDLAFVTDNRQVDVLFPTSGGSMGDLTTLALPADHLATGIATLDYNDDGDTDLVVEALNTAVYDGLGDFVSLDVFTGDGSGDFSYAGTYQTVGHIDAQVVGLVAGDFQGPSMGLEIAVPLAGDEANYIDVVPISSSAGMGPGVLYYVDTTPTEGGDEGNIVAADLDGSGKPSIAMTDDTDNVWVLLSDLSSNQFLPIEDITTDSLPGMLTVAPFMETPASLVYRGPTSDPSTLVQNEDGSWTRTYPDGTVIQFNSSGQETSESDVNGNTFTYAYVESGLAAGALATITDPVGLVTTLAYDEYGYISTITDPDGFVTSFAVDGYGNLTEVENPLGATTEYGYSTPSDHEATSETDPNGNTATAHYNSFGQLTSETLFDGTSTTSIDPAQSNGLLAPGDSSDSLPTHYDASVTDPDGRITTVTLNWMSHPTQETDATGGVTTITYDRFGFPASVTDALGRTTTYTYDSSGDITSITEDYLAFVGGHLYSDPTETITYDEYGVPTSITDFDGNTTTFVLDSHGNVLEEEQPGGVDQEWTYNSAGQVLTDTDANGATTTYSYDDRGQISEIQEPGAGSPTVDYGYFYNVFGDNLVEVTDEVGDTVAYLYDPMDQLVLTQNPVQADAGEATIFTYDGDGNLTEVTDANGNVTSYTYNARDEEVSMTDALGNTTSYGYDADGNLISVTDALDNTTTYSYTNVNQIYTVTDPTGGTTTYGYDLDNELTSVTDPNSNQVTYSYNTLGLVSGESELSGGSEVPVATYRYDGDGDLLSSEDGDSHYTTYTYNALDELTSVENADDDITSYTYDGDGDVLTVTDGLGHTTSYTYNDMGQVLTETQPAGGGATSYGYDLAGRLVSVTDPDDNTTTYSYDGANEVVTEESPTGGVTTYTYDLVGNVLSVTDPDDHEITYAYDADNELVGETWVNPEGGTPLDVFDYTYNADGELTAVSDDNSSYQYTYNADGEETSQADVGSPDLPTVTLTYDYDADGDRTSMDDSLGGLVSYTYDPRDELTGETLSGTDISAIAVANSYDNAGNMTGQTRYSNLAETDVVAATSYTYNNINQMTGITDKNSGGTTLVSYAYTYDAAGLVSQEVRTWDSEAETDTLAYTYTANDQLTGVTHTNDAFANESFSYDANGNETGTGYTTSTGNEQTASPGYTYTYDADGNMVTETNTSTGDTWTYTYNFCGQMTGAVETTSEDVVIAQVTYTYDALGNRIGIDQNDTQTWTLYDGSTPIMDFSSGGSLEMRYLNGPTGQLVDEVLARENAEGTVAWYMPDRLGTIRDLIDNSGAIIDHIDFSAFGTVLDESDPSEGDRMMGFAGMERDTVTGMNLAVYRVQNPGTGRWTTQDPLGFAAGDANIYRYVGNGPTNFTDPSGLILDQRHKRLIEAYCEADSSGASNEEIIATIIMEALYITNGNNTDALQLIMTIRQENNGAMDNDLWASADHFLNAWNAQDWYRYYAGGSFVSRWMGGLSGNFNNDGYIFCKVVGIPVGRDRPGQPPSAPTIQQWSWGNQGAWASVYYPTNMQPGSPEWRSFIAWMESMY